MTIYHNCMYPMARRSVIVNLVKLFELMCTVGCTILLNNNARPEAGYWFNDKMCSGDIIYTKNKIGPSMCLKSCMKVNLCNAVNYYRSDLKCEFLQVDFPNQMLQGMGGASYTEVGIWQKVGYLNLPNSHNLLFIICYIIFFSTICLVLYLYGVNLPFCGILGLWGWEMGR